MPRKPKWTLEQVRPLIAELDLHLRTVGWFVGLTGSVLHKGESFNDLDLTLTPMTTVAPELQEALKVLARTNLHSFGFKFLVDVETVHKHWRLKGSLDTKHVEVWQYQGKKVDIFFLS